MAPVIDMVNHSHNSNATFHIVNKNLHINQSAPSYFNPEKYLCDFSIIVGPSDVLGFKPL